MSFKVLHGKDREEWLKLRNKRIGGSECAALVGLNPWMTNVELWEIKTGRRERPDVGCSALVQYGRNAEEHLRKLYELDHPDTKVWYEENALLVNPDFPFAHASVDGLLTDQKGRLGVLEIKTATITSGSQKKKWDGMIPANYMEQILWYLAVTDAEFAVCLAQLKWDDAGDVFKVTKEYQIEREDFLDEIEELMVAGADFAQNLEKDERPALVLPRI